MSEMTAEQAAEWGKTLSFEKVWAMFAETDRKIAAAAEAAEATQKQMAETERFIKEVFAETGRRFAETDRQFKETDRQLKETDRKIGRLGNRIGDLIEHIISPNLTEKFNRLGFTFEKIAPNVSFRDSAGKFTAEVDIMLENGDTVMAVEVKTKLTTSDVREHIERMKKLRGYADQHGDKRALIGAVAAAIIPEGVKPFAQGSGFYVIEQSGDSIKIDVPPGFVAKRW
jgi:hypothetical protein